MNSEERLTKLEEAIALIKTSDEQQDRHLKQIAWFNKGCIVALGLALILNTDMVKDEGNRQKIESMVVAIAVAAGTGLIGSSYVKEN